MWQMNERGDRGVPPLNFAHKDWTPIWARVYNVSDSEISSLGVLNSSERLKQEEEEEKSWKEKWEQEEINKK